MRSAFVCFVAIALAGVSGFSHAAVAQSDEEASNEEAPPTSYEHAIRCAAIDTVIASVYSMREASSEEQELSLRYDKLIEYWITQAIALKGKDTALGDYSAVSEKLAGQVKKAVTDAEIERLIFDDMAKCADLEKDVQLDDLPAGASSASASLR